MAAHPKFVSPEEYLKFERQSEEKHEYYNGEIVAMGGANEKHNLITGNTGASLYMQLRKSSYMVLMSMMRVKLPSNVYVYPDVLVAPENSELEDDERDTLLNLTVIIEVLSPLTERNDRGRKFQHYRTLESLQEYLLISQESVWIEHYIRQGDQWLLTDAADLNAVLTLPSINCTLALADVYEKVKFEN